MGAAARHSMGLSDLSKRSDISRFLVNEVFPRDPLPSSSVGREILTVRDFNVCKGIKHCLQSKKM